jgi:Zn-dependent protease
MQDPSELRPPQGEYIPPPPIYPVTADIPPQSPHHYSPAPPSRQTSAGWLTGGLAAVWAFVKFGGLFILKIPAALTLISLVISFGGYALLRGPWFALALVSMILVHEMGHVVEIRRQGMQATAPIFIPFLGAAIFQRSHPTDAVKQAQIGIAGPIAGTLGATAAAVLYGATHNELFLMAAWLGFFLNLINMLPVWQLDGAWVLAAVSPWLQVAGYALIVLGVVVLHFVSPFLIIIAVLGIPTLMQRFRDAKNPYYSSVPTRARWALGAAWLGLVIYLGVAFVQASDLFTAFVQ